MTIIAERTSFELAETLARRVLCRRTMFDLLCYSHLRWDFVFQRPQHLLTRCAKARRVFYVEEPVVTAGASRLEDRAGAEGLRVLTPHLPAGLDEREAVSHQRALLADFFHRNEIRDYVEWFYTPMALPLSAPAGRPLSCVYDCMDELSAFKGAPKALLTREAELLARADLVFTGGHALFEAKRHLHANIHAFPSSVDCAHFAQARAGRQDPDDQRDIPHPRLGFFGVIDERMDIALLAEVARRRPDWQIVMLGPVAKIDEKDLPRLSNIHYLGSKAYADLPRYISGWDVALMPFAKNESTRFISPTKTPEYLAAGKPVVSTSIRDVVRPYAVTGLARIADTPSDFVAACEAALAEPNQKLLRRADPFLAKISWDKTWSAMEELMLQAVDGVRDSGEQQTYAENENEALEVG
ncbi:MAG TPA: glycosyltransferase family 1 protein [Polyangiaceae bacterium]|nr:glycosyltransferase family 1 protein [Polyangiaceae bacterium]